jgi:hypothetical protein
LSCGAKSLCDIVPGSRTAAPNLGALPAIILRLSSPSRALDSELPNLEPTGDHFANARACSVRARQRADTGGGTQHREDTTAHSIRKQSKGKRRTTLSSTKCRALPRRTHTMRGTLRPRVAIGLPGSGCSVSRTDPPELRQLSSAQLFGQDPPVEVRTLPLEIRAQIFVDRSLSVLSATVSFSLDEVRRAAYRAAPIS